MMAPEDLGRLIDDHAAALVLYSWQWTKPPEDVVQDSFVKLADRRVAPEHAVGWLFTTVRRAAISAARSTPGGAARNTAAARTAAWFVPTEGAGLEPVAPPGVGHIAARRTQSNHRPLWAG